MSFISSALGTQNGYNVQSGGGPGSTAAIAQSQANYQDIYNQQGTLAAQLLAQSQGQGPNLANLQLQQATNQNNQKAAGAIASQRGMNPALAQRIISQQQATNNQNAAGQSGILRAQQQLAAQQGLANVYGQQAGEAATNLGTYVGANQSANQANAQIAQNNSNQNAGIASGIISPLSSILAKGGRVEDAPKKAVEIQPFPWPSHVHPMHFGGGGWAPVSGDVPIFAPLTTHGGGAGGMPNVNPKMFQSSGDPMAGAENAVSGGSEWAGADFGAGAAAADAGAADVGLGAAAGAEEGGAGILALAARGGKIPAMISPGERVIPPHLVDAVSKGKVRASKVAPKIKGKAKVKGDSEENDIVPAALDAGGVVIPRSKADNDEDAREFLLAIKADKDKKNGPSGYAKILAAKRKNA